MFISQVFTCHETQFLVNVSTGLICHGEAGGEGHGRIYILRPTERPNWFFVLPERDIRAPLQLQEDVPNGQILSLLGAPAADDGAYVFCHPISGFMLSAIETAGVYGEVIANRDEAKEWETFSLRSVTDPPTHVLGQVASLEAALAAVENARQFMAFIGEMSATAREHLRACLWLLPPDKLEHLRGTLRTEPEALALLAVLRPKNMRAGRALPASIAQRLALSEMFGQSRHGGTASIYHIVTRHGTHIQIDTNTGVVCHGEPGQPGKVTAYVWQNEKHPSSFFLFPERNAGFSLRLQNDLDTSSVISLLGFETASGDMQFRHPISGYFLSAVQPEHGNGEVIVNRDEAKEWETFGLQPVADPPEDVLTEVTHLASMATALTSGASALAFLQKSPGAASRGRFAACLRLLPLDQLEWLARALVSDPAAVAELSALMPQDLWGGQALPDLLSHRMGHRPGQSQREIDSSLGHLATSGMWGKYVSVGQLINSFARRALPAANGICVVAAARNEGLYFLEWLAYHRKLGVDAFFIYTNDNDDGSDSLLSALASAGIITWINIKTVPGINPQHMAYGHAFQILPDMLDYRWTAIIDIDEFIVLDSRRFKQLSDFTASLEWCKTDAIALSWVMFGPNGQTRRSNTPVTRRFLSRAVAVHPLVKTINRSCMFIHSRCHNPVWDEFTLFSYRNAGGAPHPQNLNDDVSAFAPEPTDKLAWINHYSCKSAEEFILRRAKSPPECLTPGPSGEFFKAQFAQGFVDFFNQTDLPRDERIAQCVPNVEIEIDNLRRLPGVDAAMRAIEANYRESRRRLSEVLSVDPRFAVPGRPERWFADIIALDDEGTSELL